MALKKTPQRFDRVCRVKVKRSFVSFLFSCVFFSVRNSVSFVRTMNRRKENLRSATTDFDDDDDELFS